MFSSVVACAAESTRMRANALSRQLARKLAMLAGEMLGQKHSANKTVQDQASRSCSAMPKIRTNSKVAHLRHCNATKMRPSLLLQS